MFYVLHTLAIVLLSVSSFGIGYWMANDKVLALFNQVNKEK